ncbi:death-associated inhibitor of apoptosis 1 [Drosophila sulfurigaster albostrigata]|uniref:death-associated inhibitor of apoptosis 1 n=1 Tax=Drosophila sulfurigaster albostrigata TaxID=89887 RepID=UPI002D21C9A1|nr:death-associated inhibitor of apoptosis 1 [Drosophila sulfurigaster albostrigata]XP_062128954.1 death-associated inhibitor of apoptosis 1 [Drosophila sulfurigaster albostrigata]
MANVATQLRYMPPCSRPTATAATTTTTLNQLVDQVDNSTSPSLIFKACLVNRMNDKYHREDERLRTFDNWHVVFLDKKDLALTGMFFTNQEDKVKCYFCEVEIGRWERDDHPVQEHLRWSPNCPLLRRRTTNNVPINADALERILPPMSYDICGSNDNHSATTALEVREHAYSEGRQMNAPNFRAAMQFVGAPAAPATMPTMMQSSAAVEPCSQRMATHNGNYYPEYPEYAIETARLRSFEDWPRNMKQKPQQLAEAGFFYTGVGDRVRCFSCGGGLKDWDDNDEPWEQHALWLKDCRFVKLIKGQLYIDMVTAKDKAKQEATSSSLAVEEEEEKPNSIPSIDSTPSSSSSSSAVTTVAAVAPMTVEQEQTEDVAGDVAPPSAANRIFNKIVAQGCADGQVQKNSTSTSAAIPEEKLCKICYGAEYNTAFLPCGHVVACAKCASSVTKCPLCRKPFTDVMRVYFS